MLLNKDHMAIRVIVCSVFAAGHERGAVLVVSHGGVMNGSSTSGQPRRSHERGAVIVVSHGGVMNGEQY